MNNLWILGKRNKIIDILYSIYRQIFNRFYWDFPSVVPLPNHPHHVDIELTNNCNLSCPHCFGRINERSHGEMNPSLFKKIIQEMDGYPFCHLHLCGQGEPAMHSNFKLLVDCLYPMKMKVSITTNGLLFEKYTPDKILEMNIDLINVSVDGYDEISYGKHRPGGNYNRLKANLKHFHETRRSKNLQYPKIRIANVLFPNEMTTERIERFKKTWIQYSDMVVFTTLIPAASQTIDGFEQCTNTFFSINVRWDGRVPLCGYSNDIWIGDSSLLPLRKVFKCKKRKEIQNYHLHKNFHLIKFCKTCFFTQKRLKIASSHINSINRNKIHTLANYVYRKLNIGRR